MEVRAIRNKAAGSVEVTRGGRRRAPGGGGGGGMFEVNVSAGGLPEVVERSRLTCLPEVCWRSARGLPEVGRKCTKFESQRLLPTREEKYYSHTVG